MYIKTTKENKEKKNKKNIKQNQNSQNNRIFRCADVVLFCARENRKKSRKQISQILETLPAAHAHLIDNDVAKQRGERRCIRRALDTKRASGLRAAAHEAGWSASQVDGEPSKSIRPVGEHHCSKTGADHQYIVVASRQLASARQQVVAPPSTHIEQHQQHGNSSART